MTRCRCCNRPEGLVWHCTPGPESEILPGLGVVHYWYSTDALWYDAERGWWMWNECECGPLLKDDGRLIWLERVELTCGYCQRCWAQAPAQMALEMEEA